MTHDSRRFVRNGEATTPLRPEELLQTLTLAWRSALEKHGFAKELADLLRSARDHFFKERSLESLRPELEAARDACAALPAQERPRPAPSDWTEFLRSDDGGILIAAIAGRSRVPASTVAQVSSSPPRAMAPATTPTTPPTPPGSGPRKRSPGSLFVPVSSLRVLGDDNRWLVAQMIADGGIAAVGGPPYKNKSWLVSEIAFAVATGLPCMGEFDVRRTGPVLICSGDGDPGMPGDRLRSICSHRGRPIDDLAVHVLQGQTLQLSAEHDQRALAEEVAHYKPALLVLDPWVKFHGGDENSVASVAPLLRFLDDLRRKYSMSILIVHHTSKRESGSGGQRLRGSGALHGWIDSGLYVEETDGTIVMRSEQRMGASPAPMALRLTGPEGGLHLEVEPLDEAASNIAQAEVDGLKNGILQVLPESGGEMSRDALRQRLGVKNSRLTRPLDELERDRLIERKWRGISRVLATLTNGVPVPADT